MRQARGYFCHIPENCGGGPRGPLWQRGGQALHKDLELHGLARGQGGWDQPEGQTV